MTGPATTGFPKVKAFIARLSRRHQSYGRGLESQSAQGLERALTMATSIWYTVYMIEKTKKLGLLDTDFLQGVAVMLLPVLLTVVS